MWVEAKSHHSPLVLPYPSPALNMIGYMLQRAAVRRTALSFAPASRLIAAPGITVAPLVVAMRGLRVSALASAPAAKASTKKKPVAKVATKKPAAAASAPKKQAANKKPTKSWELKDANGKPGEHALRICLPAAPSTDRV